MNNHTLAAAYGPFPIVALLFCISIAVHALISFNTILFSAILVVISSILFLSIRNIGRFGSASLSALTAGVVISTRYFYYVLLGDMSNQFLIDTSDSFIYNKVAEQISITFSLLDQFSSLEHVQLAADQFGFIVPNLGQYWLLGVIYTVVGFESGPASFFILNILAAMAISFYAVLIASHLTKTNILEKYAILFALLIFSISAISDTGMHLRKDFLVNAMFVCCFYYCIVQKYLVAIFFALFALQWRVTFAPIFLSMLLLPRMHTSAWFRKYYNPRFVAVILAVATIVISFDVGGMIRNYQFDMLDASDNISLEILYVQLRGSAVLAYSRFLQWAYVLFFPFPPLTLTSYIQLDSWDTMLTFLVNALLLYNIYVASKRNDVSLSGCVMVWCLLYCMLLAHLAAMASLDAVGAVEPRYKFTMWVIAGIVALCNSMKENSRIVESNTRSRYLNSQ